MANQHILGNTEIDNTGVTLLDLKNKSNLIVNSTLAQNQAIFSTNVNLSNGTYDFELKIVFDSLDRNVFMLFNSSSKDNRVSYAFCSFGGMFGNTPNYESGTQMIGMGIANTRNQYWSVFTGTISVVNGQVSARGQGASVQGSSIFSGKYEANLGTITSIHFRAGDTALIAAGTTLKIWKRDN